MYKGLRDREAVKYQLYILMIPWLVYLILIHGFDIPEPTAVHQQQLTASTGSTSKPTGEISLKT